MLIISIIANIILTVIVIILFILYRGEKLINKRSDSLINDLEESFSLLSAKALKDNNSSFIQMAQNILDQQVTRANESLENKEKQFESIVTPVKESLTKLENSMQSIEKERFKTNIQITEQIKEMISSHKDLRKEANKLSSALSSPNSRGRWGEIQLKRVVEMAGMISHCDFLEQASTDSEERKLLKPDMVVNLPGNKKVIIDAKTPLTSYLKAMECESQDDKKHYFKKHAEDVKRHMKQLSQKSYADQINGSVEFVVLFLPGEPFFGAALEYMPTLIEEGVQEKVIIATPTTLIALLRTVAYGWHQEEYNENIQKISTLSKELHKRLISFIDKFEKIGRSIHGSVSAYNEAVGSFDRRVLSTARKLESLDSSFITKKEISKIENENIRSIESNKSYEK